jgi:putative nucleotidyltransferase with HDIG domain
MATLDQSLVRASVQANDSLATLEAARLNDLRALAATPGLPAAVAAGDASGLSRLFASVAGPARDNGVRIRVLDGNGKRLFSAPAGKGEVAYGGLPAVTRVLKGATDSRGDKYVALVAEPEGEVVYWAAPVRQAGNRVIGAVLLGQSVTDIAAVIRPRQAGKLFFYGPTGQPFESPAKPPPISREVRQSINSDHLMRVSASISGRPYAVAVTDWTMRGEHLGYLGIALPADGVIGQVFQLRLVIVLLFVGTALLVLLVGGLLARRITRPLERLVSSMKTVAAGDLTHRAPAGPPDEIGYLTTSFNEMTANLEEKTKTLEATWFASIEALARAIDARDPHTYGHSARVARLSLEIADEMGLETDQMNLLRQASLLHDIGKIGVEDRVLRKPGPLDSREMEAMREHPIIGYEMLKGLIFLEPSLPGIRHHHEHWDGTGYPDGLHSEDIPPAVRILTVADTLDAMTSDRPYRAALSFDEAVRAIEAGSGKQFDPAVVRALRSRIVAVEELLTSMGKHHARPFEVVAEPAI